MNAIVRATRDPDIPIGTEVTITGYTAAVPNVKRTVGLAPTSGPSEVAFLLNELEFRGPTGTANGAPETGPAPRALEKRTKLPTTRPSVTHQFDVGGQKGYITVGFYDKDMATPGEVFITVQRQGSTLQGLADAWARSLSMLLQYGVPVAEVARMFAWHKFEPRGVTPNPDIRVANSIVDYVARYLGHLCVPNYTPGGAPVEEVPDVVINPPATA